ncbi:carbohydrate-binding module family 1 protein [Xylariomycetidae sp. FL0641]|nr:carbohydrate-binding module family 1 protein [Xylariomycetidae sp. FL0641]
MQISATSAAALAVLPGVSATLNSLAKDAGLLYFGTSTDNGELTDADYVAILSDSTEFGQITPGNGQKWQFTEPSQGSFDYTSGDEIVELAEGNGQILRCHTLVWYSQLPSWVSGGSWTKDTLTEVVNTHIANEVGHYKGQCYAWDVVNEALADDASYRDNVFLQVLGESYIPLAFQAADAADPDAKLYYNDYNIEGTGAKQEAAAGIVKLVKEAGARIDGVGMQAHLIVGSVQAQDDLQAAMQSYVDAGASEVAYTELDIRHSSVPASDSALQQQAADYATVTKACLAVDACVGITIWDFSDRYSWVPDTFPGTGQALIYDEDFGKKPAWTAISSALAAAATGGGGGGAAAPATTTKATSAPTTTLATSSTKAPAATPTSGSGSGSGACSVAKWGQCGGTGFSGCTTCAAGATCKAQNDYYSQCL